MLVSFFVNCPFKTKLFLCLSYFNILIFSTQRIWWVIFHVTKWVSLFNFKKQQTLYFSFFIYMFYVKYIIQF